MSERPGESLQRIFFALWPCDQTRESLAHRTRKVVRAAGGRRIPAENLHITLAFLGNITAQHLACVREAAREVRGTPFALLLDRLGLWPKPQILWLAPRDTPDTLLALVDELWTALQRCDMEREARPYRAHMTLARKVSARRAALGTVKPVHWPLREFALIESVTDRRGARYRVLESWPLQ